MEYVTAVECLISAQGGDYIAGHVHAELFSGGVSVHDGQETRHAAVHRRHQRAVALVRRLVVSGHGISYH